MVQNHETLWTVRRQGENTPKPPANDDRMRTNPSVVKEKAPHANREEQCGDYAKQRAGPACQQKACDGRPNEAGECYASFQRHYSPLPHDPRPPADQPRLLAKPDQRFATDGGWLVQASLDAAMPTPTEQPLGGPMRC